MPNVPQQSDYTRVPSRTTVASAKQYPKLDHFAERLLLITLFAERPENPSDFHLNPTMNLLAERTLCVYHFLNAATCD